jgi:hypothetical protein
LSSFFSPAYEPGASRPGRRRFRLRPSAAHAGLLALIVALSGAATAAAAGAHTEARRYVAQTGSDANPGTRGRPWRSIARAVRSLQPGQTLFVRSGTYVGNLLITRGGTATRPITIRNYPGERPVLRAGTSDTDNMPLQIGSGAAHLRFRGLVFEGATGPSTTNVYIWGSAHHIELSACEIRGSERQGFFSESTTRAIRIRQCYVHDNGGRGRTNLDHNIYVEGRDHVIANCVIAGARNGYGIQLYPASDHVRIVNNTIVGNRSGIIVGGEGSDTTTNAVVANNIVAFNLQYGVTAYWGDGSRGRANWVMRNLGYGNRAGNFDSSEGGLGFRGNVRANPRFRRRRVRDFRLRARSPAVNRALRSQAPSDDFSGRRRPSGRAADLGAFERPG